jgi:hypothetical protein
MSRVEYLDATKDLLEKKVNFYNMWKNLKLNAIISPVFPTPSIDFGTCDDFMPYNHYAILYNILDLPAGCIPIKRLD